MHKRKADSQLTKKPQGLRKTVLAKRVGAPGVVTATRGFSGSFGSKPGEKKFFDRSSSQGGTAPTRGRLCTLTTADSFQLVMAPLSGPGFDQRVGRKTTATQIYIRGVVGCEAALWSSEIAAYTTPSAGQCPAQQVRMIMFVDLQPNGQAPGLTDVLLGAGSPNSQLNPDNRDRFKILKDKVWVFDPMVSTATQNTVFNRTIASLKIFKKLPNIETTYNANSTNDITSITSGAIYLYWVGDRDTSRTDQRALARYNCRVRYMDN